MAHEFVIEEARWSPRKLRSFLNDWSRSSPVRLIGPPIYEGRTGGPWMWIFGEGSVRGCSVRLERPFLTTRAIRLRLNTLASRQDWLIAQALIREILSKGGGRCTAPDGRVMRPEDLREPRAGEEALAGLRDDASTVAGHLRGSSAWAALPNPGYSMVVTKALVPALPDKADVAVYLEGELQRMAARYQAAHPAPHVALPDGSSLAMWSQNAALMERVDHVGISRSEHDEEDLVLHFERFLETLSGRIEVISADLDHFYVPALEPGRAADEKPLAALIEAAQPLRSWLERFQAPPD